MILVRSPDGVVSDDYREVVLRVRPEMRGQRVSLDAFRAGALDAAIRATFGEGEVAAAKARHANPHDRSRWVAFAPEEIDQVVASIRGGMEAMSGGSRCHTTYRGRDGRIFAEDFDEGHTEERPCDEHTLRNIIAGEPETFLLVLRTPRLVRFRETLAEASFENARRRLADVHAFGECFHHAELLEAVLDWPGTKPDAAAVERMTHEMTGLDVFHAIRSAIGYGKDSPEVGRFGLRYFAALEDMLGSRTLPDFERTRADFRVMVGDAP